MLGIPSGFSPPTLGFPLCSALQTFADPSEVSHPHIDRRVESPKVVRSNRWRVSCEPPPPLPSPASIQDRQTCDKYHQQFQALKRRYYFEHADGGDRIFELDFNSHSEFHRMLQTPADDDHHLPVLIEAINRSYCPHHFEDARDSLYLWIGHRLDEQPTKTFVADEYVPNHHLGRFRLIVNGIRESDTSGVSSFPRLG